MEKRRFLAILMTVFMVITMLPTMVFAAEVPAGALDGKLAVKGLAAVDEELSADYTKVKPEGMTDDGVTFQWSREVSETELVEIGTEKTYKVTQEDLGYKLVLTITGKEDLGITGTLTAKTKEVLQTKEEAQTREEQDKAAEEAAAAEESAGEETAEQVEETAEAEQTTEEIPEAQPDGTQTEVAEEASEAQTEETEQPDEQVVYDETPENTSEETVEEIEIPEAQPDGTIEGQTPELTYTAEVKSDEEDNVLDFGTAEEGLLTDAEVKYVTVKNTGTGALNFTEISPEHFMVQDITEPLEAGEETSLWIQPREELAAGEYEDTITYTSEEGAEVSFTAKISVGSTELEPVDNPEEEPTETPAEPTETPAEPTETPAEPTETPAEPTEAPTEEPVRTASLDVQELDFGEATVGYGELEAKTVTVTNTGNTELTLLNPETSGTFKAGALSAETLAAGESASFTIVPETGLDAGVYQEKISVWETEKYRRGSWSSDS